ncbi:MAG: hypothetical protein LBI31_03030 [Zoogloeaceae bacterium]|jgi:hypothetical protein|nr:hypothetical protein [Zoogloeaceae bacterium]
MRITAILLSVFLLSSFAYAEIEKLAVPSGERISFYWWPKLAPIDGWHQDQEHSFYYSANALAPDGFTFGNAETVMFASALYKPRSPEIKSLEDLIEADRRNFESNVPGVSIQEVASLSTADGQKLRSFTFFPAKDGNWERVSYGEEDDFYLLFTISSRSRSGFDSAVPAYEKLVSGYRK